MTLAPERPDPAAADRAAEVAESLRKVVDDSRARRAAELRNNPQRFRLVKS